MSFGENLKKFRRTMNLSQQELADRTGVTQQSISQYENGKNEPSIDWLIKTAKEFSVSIDFLVGYSGFSDKHPHNDHNIELNKIYDALSQDKKEISKKILMVLQNS